MKHPQKFDVQLETERKSSRDSAAVMFTRVTAANLERHGSLRLVRFG